MKTLDPHMTRTQFWPAFWYFFKRPKPKRSGTELGIGRWAKRALTQMQIARMRSVLNTMSDAELSQIGVQCRDIDTYAQELVEPQGRNTEKNKET